MGKASLVLLAVLALGAPAARADDAALAHARAVERDLVALIERVSQAFVVIGGGSGVIVSPEGDILTNDHVAGSRNVGQTWTVMRPGGVIETARMIGKDPRGDIALLRLEGKGPYPFVPMADSDQVQAGDAVIALGNPFGFSKDGTPHVTLGVVSAVHRYQGGYSDAIQTDTAINPGNSGGPLLDLEGRVIGINGRIAVRFGTRANTGVGYAIPTNQIRDFIPHFREKGIVHHGLVPGIVLRDTPRGGDGALVERVTAGSAAAEKGLRAGDVIVEVDGRAVNNPQRFQGIIGTYPAGQTVAIVARRGDDTVKVEVALEPRSADEGGTVVGRGAYLGVRMSTHQGGGVEVEEVVKDSPAEQAGLATGDVIKRIVAGRASHDLADVNTLVNVLSRLEPGAAIKLTIARGEGTVEVEVKLGRRPANQR
ncbi:MAG: trypsin-like peptidase domain-containing protein [Planctomycetes bacterium]|nr:trypsin-like peptidase domain-containing protein [Planctomycetota bacterium]